MSSYNQYHSGLKIAAALDLLPSSMKKSIPKSTLHNFKQADFSELIGAEYFGEIDYVKQFARDKKAIRIYKAAIRIKQALIQTTTIFKRDKEQQKICIVKVIERVKDVLNVDRICRYFNITRDRFNAWKKSIELKCADSPIKKCKRIWTNQLTTKETNVIETLCSDPFFMGWPISSIAGYALKNGFLFCCLSTWYKYVKAMGITRAKSKSRRKKNKLGIRSNKPNELWHADITVFKTMDNVKAYIYLLMDNFSRYILSWRVSLKVSAQIRMETIKEAYDKFILPEKDKDVLLMTDGGCENRNRIMDDYLNEPATSIRQIIAQKDVDFSNSIIESVNKTIKYRWLYQKEILHFKQLVKYLNEIIPIYNDIRPHYAFGYLTPGEVFEGAVPGEAVFKQEMETARKERIKINQKAGCGVCE